MYLICHVTLFKNLIKRRVCGYQNSGVRQTPIIQKLKSYAYSQHIG